MCLCSVVLFAGCSQKSDAPVATDSPIDESNVRAAAEPVRSSPGHVTSVVRGDTRLHTSDSADAFGNRLGAEEALRFTRGEEVTSTPGLNAQLKRPLDLLVIADDTVGLGIGQEIYNVNPASISDPQVKRWSDMLRAAGQEVQKATCQITSGQSAGTNPRLLSDSKLVGPISMGVWRSRGEVVERYNEPGQFTAFIGDEFTPAPGDDNLHRVVVFRDGSDKASSTLPFSSYMSEDLEDLWQALSAYEKRTGGQALAKPQDSNLLN